MSIKRRPKEKWLNDWTDSELKQIDTRAQHIRKEVAIDEESAWYNAEMESVHKFRGGKVKFV